MYTTIADPGDARICYLDPVSGKFWDPGSRTLQPYDPAKHLLPFEAVKVVVADGVTLPAGLFANLKTADDGGALGFDTRLIGVIVPVDGAGVPTGSYEAVPNPYAVAPSPYGPAFSRY